MRAEAIKLLEETTWENAHDPRFGNGFLLWYHTKSKNNKEIHKLDFI
jgi:hypothetical protein